MTGVVRIMRKNNKLTIFLLIGAILSGAGGWYFTNQHIETEVVNYKHSFDEARAAISVVVAAHDLNIGDVVTAQNAQIRKIPRAYVHKDAILPSRFDALLNNRQLVHPVKAGEPILSVHVNKTKIEGLSSLIEKGQRAITIPVDSLDTISGFLNPGDFVDLYITLKDGERDRTVPLVENVKVLATGTDIDDGIKENSNKPVTEITLGVTPLNATKIIHGQTVGDIAVVLRRPEDQDSTFEDYVTIDNLIDIPQEAAPEPQRRATWGFELIKGGTRS